MNVLIDYIYKVVLKCRLTTIKL